MRSAHLQKPKTGLTLPDRPASLATSTANVTAYLKSANFICWPGRESIKKGRIKILPASVELQGPLSRKAGKLPQLIELNPKRTFLNTIVSSLREIRSEKRDGVVFVFSDNPKTQTQAYNLAWKVWVKIATAVNMVDGISAPPNELEAEVLSLTNEILDSELHSKASISFSGKDWGVFGTALGPSFSKPHPRYAPAFCVAIVSHLALRELGDSFGKISAGIRRKAYELATFPYPLDALVPLPRFPSSEERYALVLYSRLSGDRRYQLTCPKSEFVAAAVVRLVEIAGAPGETMAPNGARNVDTNELIEHLIQKGVLAKTPHANTSPQASRCPFKHGQ